MICVVEIGRDGFAAAHLDEVNAVILIRSAVDRRTCELPLDDGEGLTGSASYPDVLDLQTEIRDGAAEPV